MKVFLDVGAHIGQTLAAAQRWDFGRIVCFEPVKAHLSALAKVADERAEIEMFGLWNKTALATLHHPGTKGASLWERAGMPATDRECLFVRASTWLNANLANGDTVWMKLNVEGAELDVITDMLDSGEFARVSYLQVMWDARKIPAIAERMAEVRNRIDKLYAPPRVISSEMVPPGATCEARVDNWLAMTGGVKRR